ncbi:MAG: RnfABCDGE type electron transport complex subunit B [Thermoanaerobaculia bacterium]|nr:MAG: RnfABCDGE type electron transport complex subunit B [Thermoanaerobaculia bacterium]MBZ0103052.1 RnfABCDGE type electron transport complex subunit B [Thermoanaerobaculia bacterium]
MTAVQALAAIAAIGGLTLLLATLLVLADRKLRVVEDPRIDQVDDMLPHANCGACGYPGCRPFAEALVAGSASPGGCTVSSDEGRACIAAFLGVAVGGSEKRVARLACAGGANVARHRAHYDGHPSCRSAALVAGGGKGCFWGCLGLADCAEVCDFDAIRMDSQGLPVVDEAKCTACGDCVEACPKDLFSLQPISRRLWVACRSLEAGDEVLEDCRVGCTACGRCAQDAPGLITMQHNLPVVDYTGAHGTRVPIERCPTGAIVWLDPAAGPVRGAAAPRIVRREPRREAAT